MPTSHAGERGADAGTGSGLPHRRGADRVTASLPQSRSTAKAAAWSQFARDQDRPINS